MSKDEYLITDTPLKALTVFAMPMIFGSFFQQIYNMADSIIVGRFVSSSALAAVGACAALTNVFICVALGAGVGAGVLVSRYFGAREYGKMKTIVSTSLISFLLLSIVLGVFGFFFAGSMMSGLQTPADILDDAVLYLQVYFVGFPFLFMYNILSTMFTSIGESKIPLGLLIFSSILNILMDLWMVAGLGLGVFGAAIATLIAQGISAVFSFLIFFARMRRYKSPFNRFERQELYSMLRIAVPSVLQQSTVSIGMMIVQAVVNPFGTQALAGYTATMRVENVFSLIFVSIGNAVSPYVSQNLGAKNYHRIDQTLVRCMCIVTLIGLVLGNGAHLLGNHLLHIYSDDLEVISFGMQRLSVISVTYCLCGMMDVLAGTIRGLGYSMLPMIVSLIGACVFRIIWIFTVFRVQHTLFILYASYPISWILTILAHFVCYLIVRKKVFRPQET